MKNLNLSLFSSSDYIIKFLKRNRNGKRHREDCFFSLSPLRMTSQYPRTTLWLSQLFRGGMVWSRLADLKDTSMEEEREREREREKPCTHEVFR